MIVCDMCWVDLTLKYIEAGLECDDLVYYCECVSRSYFSSAGYQQGHMSSGLGLLNGGEMHL